MPTPTITKPEIGMDCSYGIGSDAYRYVVTTIERGVVTAVSLSNLTEVGNVSVEEWDAMDATEKVRLVATYAINLYARVSESVRNLNSGMTEDEMESMTLHFVRQSLHEFTKRKDGYYRAKGSDWGTLVLGSTYSYYDPSF